MRESVSVYHIEIIGQVKAHDVHFFTNEALSDHRHVTVARSRLSYIMDACPLTKLCGGLQLLHEAEDDAVKWLESIATTAFAK